MPKDDKKGDEKKDAKPDLIPSDGIKVDGSKPVVEQCPVAMADSRLMQAIHKELAKFAPAGRGALLKAVHDNVAALMKLPQNCGD